VLVLVGRQPRLRGRVLSGGLVDAGDAGVSRPIARLERRAAPSASIRKRLLAIPFVSVFYVLMHDTFERRRASTAAATVVSEATSTS
jgi:hypothetical protein